VLRGLIYMLVDRQPSLLSHVQKRYDRAGRKLFEDVNAWVAACDIFLDILRDPALPTPYLVVDALDECQTGRSELLQLIASGLAMFPAKWIVSSRNWPEIEEELEEAERKVPLSLELNAESVATAVGLYIDQKARRLAEKKNYTEDTLRAVQRYLLQHANGTFL
jgi:hypothetical protein